MHWYLAKIVYQIICGNGQHTAQFDEQLRLIMADNEEMAFNKARLIGNHEQDSFTNMNQELVQWKFINVAELYPFAELTDGTELYSMIKETSDSDSYIHFVEQKARNLQIKSGYQNFTTTLNDYRA